MNRLYQELHTNSTPQNPQNNYLDGINKLLQQNPQLKSVLNVVKNGRNPRQMFFELAKQKGVDPNSILSLLQ